MWLYIAIIIVLILLLLWFNPLITYYAPIGKIVAPYQTMLRDLYYDKHHIMVQSGGWNPPVVPAIATLDKFNYPTISRGLQIYDLDKDGNVLKKNVYDTCAVSEQVGLAIAHLKSWTFDQVYRLVWIYDEAISQRGGNPELFKQIEAILPDFNKVTYRDNYVAVFKYGIPVGHAYSHTGGSKVELDI